jgi:hypothetical protein
MPKLTLRAQTVDIADLALRQDVLAKNALMPAQRDFGLGNSPNMCASALSSRYPVENIALFTLEANLSTGGAALKQYADDTGCAIISETARCQKSH